MMPSERHTVAPTSEFIVISRHERFSKVTSITHFGWKGTSPTNHCWVAEN